LLIEASTRPGDAVLDPFLGSGSTAVAARELGRPWTGIELSPDYHEIIRQRLAATLGL
jgi:site-specific DNA-methyltransferase (adenine-specific)